MEIKQRMRMVVALCATLALTVGVATATAGSGGNSEKKLCRQGGWQTVYGTDGTTFASQKECVSYVANGGTLTTTPPPLGAQKDCELFGGAYSSDPASDPFPGSDHKLVWTCVGWSASDLAQWTARSDALNADCQEADPAAVYWGSGYITDAGYVTDSDCAVSLI